MPAARRTTGRSGALLAATVTACALMTACTASDDGQDEVASTGAMTRDQYQQSIVAIRSGQEATEATRLFFSVVGELDKADCSVRIHRFHDLLASILRQVGDLDPPAEAADVQRDFLAAANKSVRYVEQAATDVDEDTLSCGEAMNARIYGLPSTLEAERALERLEKLGYTVLGE
jgi:hypothetical protein